MSKFKDMNPSGVELELGGKLRHLQYDLNAFGELEERFGSVEEAMKKLQGGGMKSIKTILWAGLIHEEVILDEFGEAKGFNITPYEVGSWLTLATLPMVSDKLNQAIMAGMPDVKTLSPEIQAKVQELMDAANKPNLQVINPRMATIVPDEVSDDEQPKNV